MSDKVPFQTQRGAYIIVLLLVALAFVHQFLIPVMLAGSIALTLYPFQLRLQQKGWKKNRAAALLATLFTVIISIPFVFFITKGTMLVIESLDKFSVKENIQVKGVQAAVKSFHHEIMEKVMVYAGKFPMVENFLNEERLNEYIKSFSTFLVTSLQNFASNLPLAFLFLLIMVCTVFSFLNNASGVRHLFQSIFGFSNRKMDQFVGIFLRDSRQVYISNVVTGGVQATIVATGVYFVTGTDWFLVFFITLILAFIPVIGAAPVAFIFALVAFLKGNTAGAIILIVLGSFTGIIDNFLRPWLASFGQTKAPPIVSFIFVIGGALLLGVPGLFLGLLVGALVYDTLPLFWEEIYRSAPSRKFMPTTPVAPTGNPKEDQGDHEEGGEKVTH